LTVSPSPVWTVDEHVGRYWHKNNNWYYIKSNTADVLTLSDPEDTLSNESNIDWNIEKYFKVSESYQDVITVEDDDNELISGTYDYYIGFVEVVIQRPYVKVNQPRYYFQQETWKTGQIISFEEV